ncbi:MAG TPA: S8 family serine peptidase, partial [Allosphingosinicella sp.]|nr:S8 family serine peptidase [Allosphingosinicella sp.]
AEDAAEEAAKAAEDAAEEQAQAEQEAAEDAADAAHDAERMAGAAGLREIAAPERPELDREGYPVRRGEVVGLDLPSHTREAALARGFTVVESTRLEAIDAVVTRLAAPAGMSANEALAALRAIDPAATVDVAHYYGLHYGTSGGRSARVGLAVTAGSSGRRGPPVRVGMIDTGVAAHPALNGVTVEAREFTPAAAADTGHGTAVASLLARDGATQIVAANVFRGDATRHFTSADAIIRGLAWLSEADVPVINISLAGPRNLILDRLIARVVARGHIVVAAAGNGGPAAPPAYPAALPNVVAVTAVDSRNRVYRYANRGAYVLVAARGVAVPAAAPGGRLGAYTGTSFAAPHVAAVLARCARRVRPSNSACVANMARQAVDLGDPGRDPVYGLGLIR